MLKRESEIVSDLKLTTALVLVVGLFEGSTMEDGRVRVLMMAVIVVK